MSLFLLNVLKNSDANVTEAIKTPIEEIQSSTCSNIGYASDANIEANLITYIKALERVVVKLKAAILVCTEMVQISAIPDAQLDDSLRKRLVRYRVDYINYTTEIKDFANAFVNEMVVIQENYGQESTKILEEHFKALLYAVDLLCLFDNVEYGNTALKIAKFLYSMFKKCLDNKNEQPILNVHGNYLNNYDDVVIGSNTGDDIDDLGNDLVDIRRYTLS